jgi:cation-transporting P-type ATPase E
VTAVGAQSYAARVTGEARSFRHPRSPLERAINKLLYTLVAVMVPLGTLLGYALWERDAPISRAFSTTVAAVVTVVPEGLILLVGVTFAASAIRMARRGVLAQQLNAIESLASVDVVCLDKTGTLTEPGLRVLEVVAAEGEDEALGSSLAQFATAATAKNATLQAIAERFPAEHENPEEEVAFSSRWRWSGVRLGGVGYVLGAPELFPLGALAARARKEAEAGRASSRSRGRAHRSATTRRPAPHRASSRSGSSCSRRSCVRTHARPSNSCGRKASA